MASAIAFASANCLLSSSIRLAMRFAFLSARDALNSGSAFSAFMRFDFISRASTDSISAESASGVTFLPEFRVEDGENEPESS